MSKGFNKNQQVFQECLMGVSRVFPWYFKEVSWAFHEKPKGVLRNTAGYFDGVLSLFQRSPWCVSSKF